MPRACLPPQYGWVKSNSVVVAAIPFGAAPVFPADVALIAAGGVSANVTPTARIAAQAPIKVALKFKIILHLQFVSVLRRTCPTNQFDNSL
jgi:hypothetical protein